MSITVSELAALVQGNVQGDGQTPITGAAPLNEAQPGQITFVASAKYLKQLKDCQASAAVVSESVEVNGDAPEQMALIRTENAMTAFIAVVQRLRGFGEPPPHGIDPKAIIHPTVEFGENCSVYPNVVIGEGCVIGDRCILHPGVVLGRHCRLGDDVVLHPNTVLYDGMILGNRVVVHANCTIGADGFGYRFENGQHQKIPQMGHVEICDDVEIGAGSAVDRGTFGATRIGQGCKLDNLVMIAHNVQIGAHTVMAAQTGIAGSAQVGSYVVLAGQTGVADHITVGDGAVIGPQTGVVQDVPVGGRHWGCPNVDERLQKRMMISLRQLPEMRLDFRAMKKQMAAERDSAA